MPAAKEAKAKLEGKLKVAGKEKPEGKSKKAAKVKLGEIRTGEATMDSEEVRKAVARKGLVEMERIDQ